MTEQLKFSPALGAQAGACATKIDWANAVQSGLGPTRTVRCFHDPAGGADPVATGTEFLIVGATGAMQMVAGNITYLGKLSGATKQTAVDLSTGTAALRMEGRGEWVQGSLGLPNADTLFHVTANIAAGVGFAFKKGAGVKAPMFLDSGTGPLSPVPGAGIVEKFRLCDWSTGARVVVGTAAFTQREPNLVMQRPWMATEMGDVRQMRVPDGAGLVLGTGGDAFIFAGDYLLANPVINSQASVPLQQVEVRCKPYGRWTGFPFKGTFNIATDTTVPPAHKIELLDANDNIIDVIEMYSTRDASSTPGSGKPVNDPSLCQVWDRTDGQPFKPVQPWWNCMMVHAWQSHLPKVHSLASHLLPGVDDESVDPSNVAAFDADPDQWPTITDNFLWNGLASYKIAPKWSRAKDGGLDTALIDATFSQPARENYVTQAIGYGFEPGSTCKHTWYMAPGGSRNDRGGWPHVAVSFMTKPNGARPHGNVPWREMWHHWTMGYFNHGHHYNVDVYRGYSIPKARILAGETCYNDTYYAGGNENFRADLDNSAIRLLAAGNAVHGTYFLDKNGRSFGNQWSRDILHNQSTAALGAYLTVSPRHVLAARHSFTAAITAAFDMSQGITKGNFMVRSHAWYMWQMANMWIVANEHPDGFTTDEIEEMWGRHLEQCYDLAMPEYLAQNTVWGVTLKRFGIHMDFIPKQGGGFTLQQAADLNSKIFYFAQAYLLMKQSGSFATMIARSPKCKAVLETIMQCLTTYAVGVHLDANGVVDTESPYGSGLPNGLRWPTTTGNTIADIPADWIAFCDPAGPLDFIHQRDGSYSGYLDAINTTHFRSQWLWMVRDFFPEYSFPRLTQGITKLDSWYATVKQKRLDGTGWQWHYRFAMMGKFNAPALVGPPA